MLNGMMITCPEGLDVTPAMRRRSDFTKQIPVRAIQELHEHMVDLMMTMLWLTINALADRVVHRDAESVFDSRIVFIIGSSGTGKTTLATKIAAYFKNTAFPKD